MKAVWIAPLAALVGCVFAEPFSTADAATYTEKVLWSFGRGTDGKYPYASLIDVNGTFFGTTLGGGTGGTYGAGTVFSFEPGTGTEKVLYSFCSQVNCADGASPYAGLIYVKGLLYGTTEGGGGTGCYGIGCGTVFSLDPNTGAEKVLYSFCSQQNCTDGSVPFAGLIHVGGKLYGTTVAGGTNHSLGTVFMLDLKTDSETVLYSFCSQGNCADGESPGSALIDVSGTLYGTTLYGGNYVCSNGVGCGTVFSLDPDTGAEKVLHSFGNGADGANPRASLIDVNGKLYGTTMWGGGTYCRKAQGCGTVFSLDESIGTETVLYPFLGGSEGDEPYANLIDVSGTLYGTTLRGGKGTRPGKGTAFSIDPNTGTENVLQVFGGGGGAEPAASLLAVNGNLYGTTSLDGPAGYGTMFVLKEKR